MAELQFPNILGSYQQGFGVGRQVRDANAADERRSRLSDLAAQAYGTQGDARQGLVQQAVGVDPEAGFALGKTLRADDDAKEQTLLNTARLLASAPEEMRPALYQRIRPSVEMHLPNLPPEYGPQVEQGIQAFIASRSSGGGDTKVVGGALVDANGNVLYQAPQRFLTAQGLVEVGRDGVRELRVGQGPETFTGSDGTPVRIDPDVSPEDAAAIRATEGQFATQDTVRLPDREAGDPSAGRILPASSIAQQQQLEFQRAAQARADAADRRAADAAQRAERAEAQRQQFGTIPPGWRINAAGTALEPVPGGPKPAGAAATEGERKAATLLQRLNGSLAQMQAAIGEDKSASSPSIGAEIGRNLPLVGEVVANVANTPERQRVEAAQLDILDAALTLGTGAAYTREQLQGYRRAFFPQIGDSEATIADKAARLENVISAARIAAGRAAPQEGATPSAGNSPARPTSDAEYNALPSGALFVDPDDGQTYRKP